MKICHVSVGTIKTNDPERWLNSVSYFTRILDATAAEHEVVSFHYCLCRQTIQRNGVTYKFLKWDLPEKFLLTRLIDTVRADNPDVIVLHGLHSSLKIFRLTNAIRGARIYAQHHGERVLSGVKAFMQTHIDKYISGYFFSSAETGSEWVIAGLIEDSKKVVEVCEVTSSFEVSLEKRMVNNELTFLWVGRIDSNKDPETLLDGFLTFLKSHTDAKLYVISKDNELLENLRSGILGFEGSIEFVGTIPQSQMQHWYGKVNFLVSTSLFEAGGVSVLEAMSIGCIPILTNIPPFRAITNNAGVGVLFQPGSPDNLAEALIQAARLDIPKEQQKVSNHFAQNLSAVAIAKKINEVITGSPQKEQSSSLQ